MLSKRTVARPEAMLVARLGHGHLSLNRLDLDAASLARLLRFAVCFRFSMLGAGQIASEALAAIYGREGGLAVHRIRLG